MKSFLEMARAMQSAPEGENPLAALQNVALLLGSIDTQLKRLNNNLELAKGKNE